MRGIIRLVVCWLSAINHKAPQNNHAPFGNEKRNIISRDTQSATDFRQPAAVVGTEVAALLTGLLGGSSPYTHPTTIAPHTTL